MEEDLRPFDHNNYPYASPTEETTSSQVWFTWMVSLGIMITSLATVFVWG